MAYVDKFTVSYQRTINLGNYNQIKLSIMPTVHLQDGDDIHDVLETVWDACRQNVEHAAQPIVAGYGVGDMHGITEEELLLGIPIESASIEFDQKEEE